MNISENECGGCCKSLSKLGVPDQVRDSICLYIVKLFPNHAKTVGMALSVIIDAIAFFPALIMGTIKRFKASSN